jgi:hypothetical protein
LLNALSALVDPWKKSRYIARDRETLLLQVPNW